MNKTILVVDDLSSQRMSLYYTLTSVGYEILQSKNGQEALETLKAQQSKIHLIISDLQMPVMDGITLLQTIKLNENLKNIPLLMLLMESQVPKKDELRQKGAVGWIVKPFQPEQLCAVVRKIIS